MSTELQKLFMVAQQDPEAMDEIRRLMQSRMMAKQAAGMTATGSAPMSYQQMSLEDMVARGSGQEADKSLFGGIKRIAGAKEQDVGGGIGIMDWLAEF